MKVVLVALFDVHNFAIRILDKVLSSNGYDVTSIFYKNDYSEQESTPKELSYLVDKINSFNPDIVGFTIRSAFFPEFKRIARLLDTRIIVGGQHPTVCPEDFEGIADTVCIGEGEEVICDIVEGRSGKVYGGVTKDINIIPSFSGEYVYSQPLGRKKMSVLTSRGCFFNCSFCYNSLQRKILKGWIVRRRDVENVIAEISILQKTHPGLEEIVFSDNIFTWGHGWLQEFSREFRKTGLRFRCFGHFGMTDSKTLTLLGSAGCHMITLGIQGCERIRREYFNKYETDGEIIECSKAIASSKITGRYDLLRDVPYETEDDKQAKKELIDRLERPFITREFPLLYHPKTELTQRLLADNLITEKDIQGIATNAYKKWGKFTRYDEVNQQ